MPPRTPLHRRWRTWLNLAFVAAFTALLTTPTHAAGLLLADGRFGGVLEQTDHQATVTINNRIAVTEIEQVFRNTENRTVEALYVFPVPEGASVANFSMWIAGQEMVGEVLEKQRAREIYDSYKQQPRPKDPGLLEQVDFKNFELRIFPIGPEAEQRIKITYYQKLDTDHDWSTYTYPLATTSRRGVDAQVSGRFAMNVRLLSEVPIDQVESNSHAEDFVMTRRNDGFHEASLELTGGQGAIDRDVVLAFHTTRPKTGLDLVTSRPEGEDGYFMMTLTAGEELEGLSQSMDYVFLLDVSGSMGNAQKLRLSTASLNSFIDALQPEDRFEIITFNVSPAMLFSNLAAADEASKRRAADFLRSRDARGGTSLRPALEAAFRYSDPDRPLNIVVLSDGMTEQAETSQLLAAANARPDNATIFTIGVGNEVNRRALEQLAEHTGGLSDFLSRGDNFKRRADAFRRKLTRPIANNLSINIAGANVYDVEPATLPNLFHGTPVHIFGRYRTSGPAEVTIDAEIAGRAIQRTTRMTFPDRKDAAAQSPEIERMWAWSRIDSLLKQADAAGSRTGAIEEIVRLGEAYSIVTEYTSFIVLENDGEYQRWNIDRRNALRIARDREQRERVNEQMRRMRDEALAKLAPNAPRDGQADKNIAPTQPIARTAARDGDLNFSTSRRSSGGGAGAIDPISAVVGLSLLAGGGVAAVRQRKKVTKHEA